MFALRRRVAIISAIFSPVSLQRERYARVMDLFLPQQKSKHRSALFVASAPKSAKERKRSQREGEKKPVTVSQRQSTHILITILPADSVSFESFFLYLHRKVVEWRVVVRLCVIWTFFLAVFSRRL
jgi:hypothetical protein